MNYPKYDYQKAMPTLWGKADYWHKITDGAYEVGTPGHGGIMVGKKKAEKLLSERARKIGTPFAQYLCFEEDCDWAAFVYENPEIYAEAWTKNNPEMTAENPEKYTPVCFKEGAKETIKKWHPEYFQL